MRLKEEEERVQTCLLNESSDIQHGENPGDFIPFD